MWEGAWKGRIFESVNVWDLFGEKLDAANLILGKEPLSFVGGPPVGCRENNVGYFW